MGGGSEFPTNNHASNYFQQHPSQQHPLSIPQFHQPYYSSPPFPSFQNNLHLFNQPPWNTTNSPSIRSVDNFSSLPSASPSLPASSSNDSSCFYSIPSIDNDQSHPPFHPRSNVVLNQLFHNNEHQDFYNPSRENSFMSTSDSSLVLPESSLSSSTQVQPLHGTLPKEEKKIPTSSTNDDHNLLIHFYGNDEPIIFIKKIGQGGFGSVYHVRTQAQKAMRNNYNHLQYKEEEEEHREFALKVLKDQNVSLNEIKRRFEHEHILPMRAKKPPLTIEVEKINNQFPGQVSVLCIESPYMRLGSLQQKCKELSEKTLWLILQQISSALAYMYTIDKCLHRDVKPENILIKEYDESTGDIHVVLGDFGLVRSEDTISSSNKSGTPSYASPEREYSNDSDIFALGVTMFKLITGFSKIDDKTFSEHYQTKNDLSEEIKRQIGNRVSKSMIDMIIQLTRKKRPRISYQEIQEICRNNLLRHEKVIPVSSTSLSLEEDDPDLNDLTERAQAMSISNNELCTQSKAYEYKLQRDGPFVNRNNSVRIVCSEESLKNIETVELKIEHNGAHVETHTYIKKKVKEESKTDRGLVTASIYGSSHLPKNRKQGGPFKIILIVNNAQVDSADYKYL